MSFVAFASPALRAHNHGLSFFRNTVVAESTFTCLSCGACCAAFRVDFHGSELASAVGTGVPPQLTVPVTATIVRMRGTDAAPPRCVALEGVVGAQVRCTIYAQRPGPCRDFAPYAPLGVGDGDGACDRARRRFGLAPLAT